MSAGPAGAMSLDARRDIYSGSFPSFFPAIATGYIVFFFPIITPNAPTDACPWAHILMASRPLRVKTSALPSTSKQRRLCRTARGPDRSIGGSKRFKLTLALGPMLLLRLESMKMMSDGGKTVALP